MKHLFSAAVVAVALFAGVPAFAHGTSVVADGGDYVQTTQAQASV